MTAHGSEERREAAAGRRLEDIVALVALALLLLGCILVMRPFFTALLWAVVLCFTSWPLYRRLLALLRGRRTLAALVMALGMAAIVLLPFVLIGMKLAESVRELAAATRVWLDSNPTGPPEWLASLPLVGARAAQAWSEFAQDSAQMMQTLKRFIEPVSSWLLSVGIKLSRGVLEIALSILVSFFLFRDGVAAAEWLTAAVQRFGGARGQRMLRVAGDTVRGVVYGILGTALVQAVTAGIGFVIAGVPGAGFLALLTFFLSVVPVGPPIVWIPAALWLFRQDRIGWGVFMLVWGLGVSSIDNVVKPWLISHGARVPFILILFGVLGGVLAFGFIGVFLGPTLLAVGFRLAREWAAVRKTAAAERERQGAEGPEGAAAP